MVATQIATLMAAVKAGSSRFNFLGSEIRLVPTCGVFVTMNPGYAGRSELPDNLKAIVRPVSMMVPDFTLIAEIMMFAEGFAAARPLSKKMIAIMELSQQQLSKQVCTPSPLQTPRLGWSPSMHRHAHPCRRGCRSRAENDQLH